MGEKREESKRELASEQSKRLKVRLAASSEGCLLLMGAALALGYTVWLGFKLLTSPEDSQVLIGITATEIMFGRAASMAFGYSLGLGHGTVIPICAVIETVFVLIFYPLFVFSWRRLLAIRWLKKVFERSLKAAETHKDWVQKYGLIGLFVFVWLPFWMTGPVIGCVIGFLLGLRVWVNMAVVLSGTYAAILGWAVFLRHLHGRAASYSSFGALVFTALLVLVIILGHWLYRVFEERNKRKK